MKAMPHVAGGVTDAPLPRGGAADLQTMEGIAATAGTAEADKGL